MKNIQVQNQTALKETDEVRKLINKGYDTRDRRNEFIGKKFSKYLTSSVLNVGGGGEKYLLDYINPESYFEIDIAGSPDLFVDLDSTYPLPLDDGQFNCVVCTDVLEHLDEFHQVFSEMIRISNRYIIISLPNAFTEVRPYLRRSLYVGDSSNNSRIYGKYAKYYGLPLEKPEDRHRWFFTYSEAKNFFHEHSKNFNYKVIEEFPIGGTSSTFFGMFARFLLKKILKRDLFEDLFFRTYWCVLEKRD